MGLTGCKYLTLAKRRDGYTPVDIRLNVQRGVMGVAV